MPESETMSEFEKKLQEMLFGEESQEQLKKHFKGDGSLFGNLSETETREKVTRAMEQDVSDRLFQLISKKIAAALEVEGELDMQTLREKCSSVAKLQDALLLRHLDHAMKSGLIGSRTQDGTVLYYAIVRKKEE